MTLQTVQDYKLPLYSALCVRGAHPADRSQPPSSQSCELLTSLGTYRLTCACALRPNRREPGPPRAVIGCPAS